MKKFGTVWGCLLVLAFVFPVVPVYSVDEKEDEHIKIEMPFFRYRLSHFMESELSRGFEVLGFELPRGLLVRGFQGDSQEYLKGDFTLGLSVKLGYYISSYAEFELVDNYMGDDHEPQPNGYNDVLKTYWVAWNPPALADSGFTLKAGDFGTGFGRYVNNNDSPRGSIELSGKMKEISWILGYGRIYEGNIDDRIDGDSHLLRAQVHFPLGKSGFVLGTYGAWYLIQDKLLQAETEATLGGVPITIPELKTDGSVILGSIECSGTLHGMKVYMESGLTTGSSEELSFTEFMINKYSTKMIKVDISGWYILGGMAFTHESITFGIEGGFGNGDGNLLDTDDGALKGYLGSSNSFSIDEIIEDEMLFSQNNSGGLAGLTYLKVQAEANLKEKLNLSGAIIYERPTESFTSKFTNKTVKTYGIEFDGRFSYQLAKYLKYEFLAAYAMIDENWFGEDQFQIMNRIEFKY